MVNKICLSAEKHASFFYHSDTETCHYQRADQAIAMATMHAANHFPIQAIIALTESGDTALWMSRQQSTVPFWRYLLINKQYAAYALSIMFFQYSMDYHGF